MHCLLSSVRPLCSQLQCGQYLFTRPVTLCNVVNFLQYLTVCSNTLLTSTMWSTPLHSAFQTHQGQFTKHKTKHMKMWKEIVSNFRLSVIVNCYTRQYFSIRFVIYDIILMNTDCWGIMCLKSFMPWGKWYANIQICGKIIYSESKIAFQTVLFIWINIIIIIICTIDIMNMI